MLRRCSKRFFAREPQENVSPSRPAIMRGSSWCEASRPQSGRRSADLRTINRPDARIRKLLATKKQKKAKRLALFQSPKRPNEYQGYRAVTSDRPGNAIPILIGAAIIAAAILLSTLITAVGTRFVGMETPNEENIWLIDRLTGSVYKCQAPERGKALCEPETATGSIPERSKR
jgi:hypothetical protein